MLVQHKTSVYGHVDKAGLGSSNGYLNFVNEYHGKEILE